VGGGQHHSVQVVIILRVQLPKMGVATGSALPIKKNDPLPSKIKHPQKPWFSTGSIHFGGAYRCG